MQTWFLFLMWLHLSLNLDPCTKTQLNSFVNSRESFSPWTLLLFFFWGGGRGGFPESADIPNLWAHFSEPEEAQLVLIENLWSGEKKRSLVCTTANSCFSFQSLVSLHLPDVPEYKPSSLLVLRIHVLLFHLHLLFFPLYASSTSHSRAQQDSREGKESLALVLLWAARKGGAGHLETQPPAGRLHRSGFFCQAKWPHDRAPIPGESLAEHLFVWQSAHHPACRRPGWGLLHLCVQHICWWAKELHHLPLHLR